MFIEYIGRLSVIPHPCHIWCPPTEKYLATYHTLEVTKKGGYSTELNIGYKKLQKIVSILRKLARPPLTFPSPLVLLSPLVNLHPLLDFVGRPYSVRHPAKFGFHPMFLAQPPRCTLAKPLPSRFVLLVAG